MTVSMKDLNIEMQELVIEIRKSLVKDERCTLNILHNSIKKAEVLRLRFVEKKPRFQEVEQSGIVSSEYSLPN